MKKQDEVWQNFWKSRKTSFIGNILFFIRKKILSKDFVDIAIRNSRKGKILEAGCGTAINSILIGKKRGNEVYALDNEKEALEQAKRFSRMYKQKINLVKGDLFNMPFGDKEFELCWNIGTIEHFRNPLPAVEEMKRVGKVVIVIVPGHGLIWNNYIKIMNLIGIKIEGYIKLYKPRELRKLFKKSGFERIKIKVLRPLGFPYIAAIGK